MSPFVKIDTKILDSTLWAVPPVTRIFLTALLMASPRELKSPTPQLAVRSLDPTGWEVPAGWYGFVAAAGPGIVRRALLDEETGLAALERLGAPEPDSQSQAHEGRRLVRIDGGYVVLNYMVYRERDYSAAERSARYRARQKSQLRRSPKSRGPSTRETVDRVRQKASERDEP